MTSLLKGFQRMIDRGCLVKDRLNKNGCKVVMAGAPVSRAVIDFDKPGSPLETDKTRCDYLLVAEGEHACGWVAVLELKRGRLHADHVVRQLQAGASAAERLIPSGAAFRFLITHQAQLARPSAWIAPWGTCNGHQIAPNRLYGATSVTRIRVWPPCGTWNRDSYVIRFRFRPIAVSGSTSKHERAKLKDRSNMIVLRGNKEPVRMMSCGAPLVQVLR